MIECDDTNWPLAITIVEEPMTRADISSLLEHLRRWLDRSQPFVLLRIFTSVELLSQSENVPRESKPWLEAEGRRMRAYLLGTATVVPHGEHSPGADIASPADVPTRVFADGRSAVAWLRKEILTPAGMTIDL
jgi:hypothetical protein